MSIQPLAYINPAAKIASSVIIDPFTVIHGNVEIGSGTWIGSNVTIMDGARIGKNCRIFPGAVISAIPQDLKFEGEETLAIIGDNTTIREFVTVNRGTKDRWKTVVGNDALLMAYVHIAHDCIVGNHAILANGVTLGGHVIIGDYAVVGGLTAVHQFCNLGAHTMVSGGSLIDKDVPPYVKGARHPLQYAGVNSIGLRRRGFTTEKINEIQDVYRILYVKGLNVSKAVETIETEVMATPERDEILEFIKHSKRGIMKGYFSE